MLRDLLQCWRCECKPRSFTACHVESTLFDTKLKWLTPVSANQLAGT